MSKKRVRKDLLKKYNFTPKMREVLFHAESGDMGYATPSNHDMPADRYLSYQHPMVIQALIQRKLIQKTKVPDFPWKLTKTGRKVGRLLLIERLKQQSNDRVI